MEKKMARYGVLMTTTATREDAQNIARALLDAKLAACVQLMPIESCYMWQDALQNEAEILLLVKTRAALFKDAMAAIKEVHPYETPEIVALDFAAGAPGYFAWIDSVTK
ncbi:MAG TPA: divalent-cation tolerance protein CutA [Rhizomicrobium sp.]|nr:divalent-cation tolerance protein CutA [Rhizomicrobium sp.]